MGTLEEIINGVAVHKIEELMSIEPIRVVTETVFKPDQVIPNLSSDISQIGDTLENVTYDHPVIQEIAVTCARCHIGMGAKNLLGTDRNWELIGTDAMPQTTALPQVKKDVFKAWKENGYQ